MNTKNLNKCFFMVSIFTLIGLTGMSQAQMLKINYTSFTVNTVQKKIILDWATDNKTPTNYFEIQRSNDGKNFKTIALVMGPDPQKPNCDCYECLDKPSVNKQKYFYRLKHVDINGDVQLSETRVLAINN